MALIGIIRLFSPHDTTNSAVQVKGGFYKAGENVKTGCRQDVCLRKYQYVERAGIMCMNSRNLCNRP